MSNVYAHIMNIIAWMIFGMLTGLITLFLDPYAKREGIFGPMLLGIVGALTGGIIANMVFGVGITGISLHTFSVATAGSLILLFVGRIIKQA